MGIIESITEESSVNALIDWKTSVTTQHMNKHRLSHGYTPPAASAS